MDRGTFFLALVILLAAIGIGGGVWWYYTDIVPEQEAIREEIAAESLMLDSRSDDEQRVADANGQLAASTIALQVFFANSGRAESGNECETVFPVVRYIPYTTSVARAALTELLWGIASDERQEGFETSIPDGVTIQSLKLENGTLFADFSEKLEEGVGGSCRVAAIRKQIEETAKQFPTVQNVAISIDGRTSDILQP